MNTPNNNPIEGQNYKYHEQPPAYDPRTVISLGGEAVVSEVYGQEPDMAHTPQRAMHPDNITHLRPEEQAEILRREAWEQKLRRPDITLAANQERERQRQHTQPLDPILAEHRRLLSGARQATPRQAATPKTRRAPDNIAQRIDRLYFGS